MFSLCYSDCWLTASRSYYFQTMFWPSLSSWSTPSSWPASQLSICPPWAGEALNAALETLNLSAFRRLTPSLSFQIQKRPIRSASASISMKSSGSMMGPTASHSQHTSMWSGTSGGSTLVRNSELHWGEDWGVSTSTLRQLLCFRPYNSTEPVMVPMNLEFIKDLWMPNIFIYNLKTYKVIDVLSKLAGLWIDTEKNVLYSQATHITFICPMRFDKFPLDTQTCRFRVGSYSYDSSKLLFLTKNYGYSSKDTNSIALDYDIRK